MVGSGDDGVILLLVLVVGERATNRKLQRYAPRILEAFSSNLLFFTF